MNRYTYMSDKAIDAIINAMIQNRNSDNKYPMELNRRDFTNLVRALVYAYQDENAPRWLTEWIGSFLANIGETLEIEMV